jgi:hypothetical protein
MIWVKKKSVCHAPLWDRICITPRASPLKARKLKFWFPKSFRSTWCTSNSELCASQENQEWQKIREFQMICNMWKVYLRLIAHQVFSYMKICIVTLILGLSSSFISCLLFLPFNHTILDHPNMGLSYKI